MRPAFFVTMLLLLPLAQGLGPSLFPEEVLGEERVLVLEEGVWTQELWASLSHVGYTPLRMLSSTEVLVWDSSEGNENIGRSCE